MSRGLGDVYKRQDYYGELKLTILADCMCEAVSVANSCVNRVLGFVPKKLSIREILNKEA